MTITSGGRSGRIVGSWARRIGTAVLFLLIAVLLAPTVLPPFLDRIYYRGPVSDHFDGQRFFNPDGDAGGGGARPPVGMFVRFLSGAGRAPWPDHVAIRPTRPEARVGRSGPRPIICGVAPFVITPDRLDACTDPMRVIWIGHSTVLVQAAGLNILTDPIWATRSGPLGISGPRRVRDPGIRFEDLPKIDLVLVSHDHWDHLDTTTLKRLWRRDKPLIVTSLGNDRVIGVPAVTRDWGGVVHVRPGIDVIVERVHHWGTRWASDRNRALWSGFTVTLPGGNLFFAGDTGAGDMRWPEEAARHGPFRFAIIPIGAFEPRALMQGNHIGPVEAAEVFRRLGAAYALGVHWGTFQLSAEAIDAPPRLLASTLVAAAVPANRFRTQEVGVEWDIPPLGAK